MAVTTRYTAAASSTRLHEARPPDSPETIPVELRERRQWICWDFVDYRDGKKPRKVPITPNGDRGLNYNVSTAWRTFDEVMAEANERGGLGIGFVFDENDDIIGVDLDNAYRDDGGLEDWARTVCARFQHTYGERSPSGRGLHYIGHGDRVFGRTRVIVAGDDQAVERYSQDRWFAFTGDAVADKPVVCVRESMAWLADAYFGGAQEPVRAAVVQSDDPEFDAELARVCVGLLSGRRAADGEEWRRVGYALKGTSEALYPVWLEFSQRWPDCDAGECEDRWRRFSPSSTVGTLVVMAAEDSGRTAIELRDIARERLGRPAWKPTRAPSAVAEISELSLVPSPPAGGSASVSSPRTWNDTGLGRRIIAASEGRIRYIVDRGVWCRWTGTHWEDDPTGSEPQRVGKAVAAALWDDMHGEGRTGQKMPMAFVRFVMNAANRRSIDAAVAMAKSEPEAEVRSSAFNVDPDLLNVANGILDLRTLTLRPHDPAALLTKLAPVTFDPAAACPRWLAFINAVTCGDADLAGFLQRSFGLALSADQSEQRIWIHHGDGSNGKGTALAVLNRIFGTYAGPAPIEILLSRRDDGDREIGVGKLAGKRLAFAQEADDGVRLSEATVKALTGSDPLTGRFLYQNNFEVLPTWHLHLAVNDRPTIRGTDHGIWRRVTLVPWAHTFGDAEKRPRAEVEAELLAEAPGIFNWLLAGYAAWRSAGLRPPGAVDGATNEYRAESDSVRAWVADACVIERGAECPATDLFTHYRDWCRRAGDRGVSQTKFGRTLDTMGHSKDRPKSGPHCDRTVRLGIRLAHAQRDENYVNDGFSTPYDARFLNGN